MTHIMHFEASTGHTIDADEANDGVYIAVNGVTRVFIDLYPSLPDAEGDPWYEGVDHQIVLYPHDGDDPGVSYRIMDDGTVELHVANGTYIHRTSL